MGIDIDIFYKDGILNRNKLRESWIRKNLPDIHSQIIEFNIIDDISFSQKIWHYINNMKSFPLCGYCDKENDRWESFSTGYKNGCSRSCAIQLSRPKGIETRRKNTMDKYGVDHTSKLESVKNKTKVTNIERYGGVAPSCNDEVLSKMVNTNLSKYGVKFPLQNDDIYNKMISTNIERYGVEYVMNSPIIRNKVRETNLSKYGVEWQISSDITKNKSIETNNERYGVDHAWNDPDIHRKALDTTIERYGEDYISNKVSDTKRGKFLLEAKSKYSDMDIIGYSSNFLEIYCPDHDGNFEISSSLLYQRDKHGYGICTVCNKIGMNNTSQMETDLSEYLESMGIDIVRNNRWDGKEIDIFLPDYNIGIEMNGNYWHSELFKDKKYHQEKSLFFKDIGIDILHIWESDWLLKQDIVKSIILSKLGKNDSIIYARKCEVVNLTNRETIEFLKENHLQGYTNSKVCLGLSYNGELVSLMTFTPSRNRHIKNGDYWELVRFCNRLNSSVVGGAQRLFSKFRKEYNHSIISYSKFDYSSSDKNIYLKLGFVLDRLTEPGYYWCKGGERHYRFNFRKSKLVKEGFDPNLTESQIMYDRGYYKSWDSGNLRFKYNI